MKNTRWFRMIACFLAMMMVFALSQFVAFAEEGTGEDNGQESPANEMPAEEQVTVSEEVFIEMSEAPYHESLDIRDYVTVSYLDASGKAVTPEAMDPNQSNQVQLVISGLDADAEITKDTTLLWTIPGDITLTMGQGLISSEVTGIVDQNILKLSWIGEKADQVTVEIPVIPHISTENNLSGRYVLGSGINTMLGTRSFTVDNRDKLSASYFTEENGGIRPITDEDPVWVFTHVSGNYYTIRSATAGGYLSIRKDNNSLYLVDATEETAQKLLVESAGNGYYSIKYDGWAINNSSNNAEKGFGSYKYNNGNNEKFRLYPVSDLIHTPTRDISGDWFITGGNNNVVMSAGLATGTNIPGVETVKAGSLFMPQDEVETWHFGHINRDWYTVSTGSGYLNITSSGVTVSGKVQYLLALYNSDGTVTLTTGEHANSSYAVGVQKEKTFYSVKKNSGAHLSLRTTDEMTISALLSFDINGGTVESVPEAVAGELGTKIILPDLQGSKNGGAFIGWSKDPKFYNKNSNINHTYRVLYKAGTEYTLGAGLKTLYAVYDYTTRDVTFGIRMDGVIQDEPHDNKVEDYTGHIKIKNVRKEGHWVIDIRTAENVNGYYLENDVTANLTGVPTAEQIVQALKDTKISFDPETQYIHWYVMKSKQSGDNNATWHVDGVIRSKKSVSIAYNKNVQDPVERGKVKNMPGGYPIAVGSEILVGEDKDDAVIKTPERDGFEFIGWNTRADGTGISYSEGAYIQLTDNLNLYAQWKDIRNGKRSIRIKGDWPEGKPAYAGTSITLTALLTGFEYKEYTLQWQYTPDNGNTWIDVPNANEITYTYEMSDTTAKYIWRVVARNIRNKE